MLWEIVGTPHKLMATVHALPGHVPPPWVEYACEGVERFVLEADPSALGNCEFGIDRSGRHLRLDGAADLYSRAGEILRYHGYHHPFDGMKPWRAAMLVGPVVLPSYGLSFAYGVERYLTARSIERGKALDYLEEPGLIFELTDEHAAPHMEGMSFFKRAVEDIESGYGRKKIESLIHMYLTSDLDGLTAFKAERTSETPYLHAPLFIERERVWMKSAENYLASDKPTLIAVGCLHLADPDSFLRSFHQAGYQTNRIA